MKDIFRITIAFILGCIVCMACVMLANYIYDAIFPQTENSSTLKISQIIFMFCTYGIGAFMGAYTCIRWSKNMLGIKLGLIFTVFIAFVFAFILNSMHTSYLHILIYFSGILIAGYYGSKVSMRINFKNIEQE
jgi:predicted membrane-bound spermidine synthase